MKIKEQTRKLAAGCSKHSFEVVDETDEVSNHTYSKATLTWFEFDFRRVLTNFFLPIPPYHKAGYWQLPSENSSLSYSHFAVTSWHTWS